VEYDLHAASPGGEPADLGAGEQVRVVADGSLVKQPAPDIVQATAWRQRRLVFQADTLEDIAAEFNRYNRSPRIRVEGEAARQARFTGIFDADDPLSLVQLLGTDRELAFERRETELVIRPR
jgi:transmembrane sensor